MFKLGIERAKYLTLCKCPLLAFCIVKIKMFYLTQIKKYIYNSKSLQSSKNFEENDKETRQNKVKV